MPLQLTAQQIAALERITAQGFSVAAFPLYAGSVGVRRGNCAGLLQPIPGDGFGLLGEPCYLVEGNLSVCVSRAGRQWFIWKKKQIEATADRLAELVSFTRELSNLLRASA